VSLRIQHRQRADQDHLPQRQSHHPRIRQRRQTESRHRLAGQHHELRLRRQLRPDRVRCRAMWGALGATVRDCRCPCLHCDRGRRMRGQRGSGGDARWRRPGVWVGGGRDEIRGMGGTSTGACGRWIHAERVSSGATAPTRRRVLCPRAIVRFGSGAICDADEGVRRHTTTEHCVLHTVEQGQPSAPTR
jgi:hypothetical protein